MHEVADVHDTALSVLPCVAVGLGVVWMAQADPFHDSARVIVWFVPKFWPTASQETGRADGARAGHAPLSSTAA